MLNAAQVDQLKRSEESNERIGRMGGWAVVFGLLLEIGSALYFGRDPSLWRRLIPAIPTAVVALGVFLEVWFHRAASRATKALQSDAEERAAESNRMAEEARERTANLEAITAWRRVSREGRDKLIKAVKDRAQNLVVRIEFHNGDTEAGLLANEIGQALKDGGVRKLERRPNSYPMTELYGLYIATAADVDAGCIFDALEAANLRASRMAKDFSNPTMLVNGTYANLYIYAAPKPWRSSLEDVEGSTDQAEISRQ